MTDEPGFGKETHSTYEPLPEEILARRVTDPAAHTPPDSAGAPDVSTLVKTIRNGIPDDYRGPDPNDLDGEKWGPDPEVLVALSDLAATARGNMALSEHNYEAGVAQTERADRLARRVAELEAAARAARAVICPLGDWEAREKAAAALDAALAGDGVGA